MIPESRFLRQPKHFWANVRLLSQHIGYTERALKEKGKIKVPTLLDVQTALRDLGLASDHLCTSATKLTPMGETLLAYFLHRADVLNGQARKNLMSAAEAREQFENLKRRFSPACPLPMNKQKGNKKAPAYLTCIVNMLVEAGATGLPCNYDPRELTTFTKDKKPLRTLARRVDGAFPSTVNPVALWEIKEYYYTTTFGSRVADGVYESLLDGVELENLREEENVHAKHYLMVDAYDTWWNDGKSYLCRIIDMLHMGYVDEVLFGREVVDRLPKIVKEWVKAAKDRGQALDPPIITPATTNP